MLQNLIAPGVRIITALSFAGVIVAGCSKKEEPPPPPAASETTPATTPAAAAAPTRTPAGKDAATIYAETDAALKARDYERAVQAMQAVRSGPMTDSEVEAARSQMSRLQAALAAGVDSGDPRAKAAVEMLRRSSTVR